MVLGSRITVFMRIACPSCDAKYEVPEARLTPRKAVRCARCGGEWIAVAEEAPQPEPPAVAEVEEHQAEPAATVPTISAMDRLAAMPPRPVRNTSLIATCVVLVAAVAATVTWREAVVRAWPPSSRLLGSVDAVVPSQAHHPAKTAD
jgi:predicted Zn finger-like uncharacterized protein